MGTLSMDPERNKLTVRLRDAEKHIEDAVWPKKFALCPSYHLLISYSLVDLHRINQEKDLVRLGNSLYLHIHHGERKLDLRYNLAKKF